MKTIKVEVKQEHIDAGTRNSCFTCPVALALQPFIPKASVGSEWVWDGEREQFIDVPKKATNFIRRFDSRKPVKPFSFQLKYEA